MISYPNAKINLGLNVIEKRTDGYHNLESVFYPIPLADILEVVATESNEPKIMASYSGIEIPGDKDDNLCVKAYHLLSKDFDLPAIKFHLHKIIPMGAGLGGGSADASFFILQLNQLFSLGLSNQKMKNYAAQLGSDCAFFIDNVPSFATSRGDVLEPFEISLKGYFLVLINPGIHVSTKDAFAMLNPEKPQISIKSILKQPIQTWKNNLKNDFEKTVFQKFSEIEKIKNKLYSNGALYASMTGSGSSVFALFETEIDLKKTFPNYFYYAVFL